MRFFRHGWRGADAETVANQAVVVTFFVASLALLLAVFVREPLLAAPDDQMLTASVHMQMPRADDKVMPTLGSAQRAFGLPDDPWEREKPSGEID